MAANLRLQVETGTADAQVSGAIVSGTWLSAPKIVSFGSARTIGVELLNMSLQSTPDPAAILRFTKKFGALTVAYSPNQAFQFSIHDWRNRVALLAQLWEGIAHAGRKRLSTDIQIGLEGKGGFRFVAGELAFVTDTLHVFVALEIASVPSSHLRMCANWPRLMETYRSDYCRTPYFIAADTRDRYCSEACAQVAQRRAKLKWWNENRKGDSNGAKKTR